MDAATRALLRERLAAAREQLLTEGRMEIPPARSDVVSQPDDDEAPLTAMSQSIASTRNRERTLRLGQIAEALARIDEDPEEYGLCEVCEEPIGRRRLELLPWVELCVSCQDKREREGWVPGVRRKLNDYK